MQRRHALMAAAGLALPRPARAQGARVPPPSRFIIPYGPGNITDQVARVLLEALNARPGWRLAADNQPGASGQMGTMNIIRGPVDGSVFGVVSVAALAIAPHLAKQKLYDPTTDLVPIAGLSVSSSFLAVHASLPVRTVQELAAYCRARPAENPVFYYSPGNATVPHLNLEALRRELGFPMQHVPYRTSAAGNTDLLANRVQVTMDSLALTMQHMQAGTLRPLAYNAPRRHPAFPETPTIGEAVPGLRLLNAWNGLFFPRGTPAPVVEATAPAIVETLASPAFVERLPVGTQPFPLGPAELGAHIRADYERLGRLVAEIGLQQD